MGRVGVIAEKTRENSPKYKWRVFIKRFVIATDLAQKVLQSGSKYLIAKGILNSCSRRCRLESSTNKETLLVRCTYVALLGRPALAYMSKLGNVYICYRRKISGKSHNFIQS